MSWSSFFAALLPILLKYLVPLLTGGVAVAQGVAAADGEASMGATTAVIGGSLIAGITSLISGFKLGGKTEAALRLIIDKALDQIDALIDKLSAELKARARERLLQLLAKLFGKDTAAGAEAQKYVAYLGKLHMKVVFPDTNGEAEHAAPAPNPPSPSPAA